MSSITTEIPNRFDFQSAQARIYQYWIDSGAFHAEPDANKRPFTIVIPPPNVTGALHLGHALNNTLQDVIVRFKRMQGFVTLWMPGTDHAGIATQAVVERRLLETEKKSRHDLGREALVARIWQWKEEYENRILGQLRKLGCSCDWQRTRFTLDAVCARAVRVTFFDLFRKSLIYRGKRLVNWDTYLQTAVSDDEVNNETIQGHFWHLRYPLINPQPGEPDFVVVATTRPETMLGDTAVAVHPEPAAALDELEREVRTRLREAPQNEQFPLQRQLEEIAERRVTVLPMLVKLAAAARSGRKVRLPLMDREIPLIVDCWAKPELGSGCVKITPAHDPNDYEVGMRHGLPMINVLNPNGTLNDAAGVYQGLNLKQGRARIVADLEALDLIERIEDREIELPMSDRSKTPIEPYLADQWFVRMQDLAQSAMDAVIDGRVQLLPPRYAQSYLDWLSEKRDWPVSRQLWWGHQIPVWSKAFTSESEARAEQERWQSDAQLAADECACQIESHASGNWFVHVAIRDEGSPWESRLADAGFQREEDVLDTWFSSALWPHSTLGWPEQTADLQYFYPTSLLITSRDIITLWVARMVLMSLNNLAVVPFHQVYIHPKILDGFGETMSKSKGNGIDPLDVIDKFGADSLRFSMVHLTTETQDVRLPVQFECPHCQAAIEQTKKNRLLPRVNCPSCQRPFATQWAESPEDKALPRGPVLSERFEVARNFMNKLWNAARFALLRMEDFAPHSIDPRELAVEDRWILSRLSTVTQQVTAGLDRFAFAEVARLLYDFVWQEFCSFYVEILKDRLQQPDARPVAQNMLAYVLDVIARLLHPLMPFVTEEIWQILRGIAPQRGFPHPQVSSESLISAPWPQVDSAWQNEEIESQFALFQSALGTVREIRARQHIPPKKEVQFCIRADRHVAEQLQPLATYFPSLAGAVLTALGPDVPPPRPAATVTLPTMELSVDLSGHIDKAAEIKRLEKEVSRIESSLAAKRNKLANEKFVHGAPIDIVEREREGLRQLEEQLLSVRKSLDELTR